MKPNCSFYFQDASRLVLTCSDLSWLNYKIIISETLLVMVFNLVIEPFTTFFCFFYSIQCIPTSLYSGKHVYKLTTTCAKAKNDVYLCARSFSLRMSQKKTKPISIINPTPYCNLQQAQIFVKNWFHEKKKFVWMMKVPVSPKIKLENKTNPCWR
jgi:hypothetical protein